MVAGPWDNVQLPSPPNPAQYLQAWAQLANSTNNQIGQLGTDYQQGQNFQYQQRNQNLFQNGVPTQPNGQPDYSSMLQSIIKAGGASAASGLIPSLMSQQAGQEVGNAINGGGGNINTSPTAQTASGLTTAAQNQGQGPGQPQLSSTGTDNSGAPTLNSLAAERGVDLDYFLSKNPGFRRLVDQDLTAGQAKTVADRMAPFSRGASASPPPPTNDAATGGPPINAASANQGNESPTVGAGGGSPISPAPTAAAGAVQPSGPRVAQASPAPDTFNNRFGAATGQRPTPVGTEAEARQLQERATTLRAIGARIGGLNPKAAEQAKDEAAKLDDRAKQIFESIGKYNEPTQKQKDVESGNELRAAQIKGDEERYGKMLASIQGSAQAANRQLQHIQFAESLYKNPDFYSGAGEGLNLMYKRVVNALNPNNTEPLPQEAFRKTMAASVLNQVEQLKDDTAAVGGGGRIFQAQIELMEKAANNPDNTLPANRLLTEINKRASLEAKNIARMANNYKGGHLDAGFAQKLDDYYTQHPMFTKDEMQDVRLIAPPAAPKFDSPEQAAAWGQKAGVKPGEPIKMPSGRIVPLQVTASAP